MINAQPQMSLLHKIQIINIFSLPFRQAALKCCLPWVSLSLFFYLIGRQLDGTFFSPAMRAEIDLENWEV